MYRSFILKLLILCSLATNPAFGDELADRERIKAHVTTLFFNEDFSALEELAEEYRNTKARTSSGLWKLTMFYYGLNDTMYIKIKSEAYWSRIRSVVGRWEEAYPTSPTANVVMGMVLKNYAWKFRGGGYANSVSGDSWAPFYANLKVANEYMLSVKNQASVDPHWYEVQGQILNASNEGITEFSRFMDEGLDRFPDYYQLYFIAVDYLAPKWHGSDQLIEEFANKSVERSQAFEGMGMYARIYWFASQTHYDWRLFLSSAIEWSKMKAGIRDVLEKYPDQWNIQNFALFSCLAEDVDMTRDLMSKIEGTPIDSVWHGTQTFDYCTNL